MKRRILNDLFRRGVVVLALATTPVAAMAQSAVDQIVRMVEGDGYQVTSISRTLLRRYKVSAASQEFKRQVIFTVDGRVLRDVIRARPSERTNTAISDRAGAGSKISADAKTSGTGSAQNSAAGAAGSRPSADQSNATAASSGKASSTAGGPNAGGNNSSNTADDSATTSDNAAEPGGSGGTDSTSSNDHSGNGKGKGGKSDEGSKPDKGGKSERGGNAGKGDKPNKGDKSNKSGKDKNRGGNGKGRDKNS